MECDLCKTNTGSYDKSVRSIKCHKCASKEYKCIIYHFRETTDNIIFSA